MVSDARKSSQYRALKAPVINKFTAKNVTSTKARTPKRLRPSIRKDAINAADYLKYNFPIACEDCTHFNPENEQCTIGYETQHHRHEVQKKSYELSGKVALCRFMEID
jgi:hypothetical protein